MQKLLLALIVGLGGFLGASLRYLISIFAAKNFGGNFPYGTLIANILGALLIGF
ncbi:CrcB family protein, partial [Clostridium perfringens]